MGFPAEIDKICKQLITNDTELRRKLFSQCWDILDEFRQSGGTSHEAYANLYYYCHLKYVESDEYKMDFVADLLDCVCRWVGNPDICLWHNMSGKDCQLDKPRVMVDFNEVFQDGLLLLSQMDSKLNSKGERIEFCEGMPLGVFELDFEDGVWNPLIADGIVTTCTIESMPHVKWCLRLDERWIRHMSDEAPCPEC
jgi:hypothetical protein